MVGSGGPAQPSRTIAQGLLEVKCRRCETRASIPLDAVCRSAIRPSGSSRPRLNAVVPDAAVLAAGGMIKLTREREIDPIPWVHPDDER
jgi:hypothetical protein